MAGDLEVAIDAAAVGAGVAMEYFARVAQVRRERKPDGSLVTEADRAVEQAVRAALARARPGDAVLGEEGGQTGDGRRRWILDPIDGTVEFAAGTDRWLVLLALEVDGAVAAGVAVVPAQRRVWWAARGEGAYVAEFDGGKAGAQSRISVRSGEPELASSRLAVVPEPGALPEDEWVYRRLAAVTPPLAWGAHPALLVASGELDLAVQTRGAVWDFAAPSLILTEAGGRFGGLDGGGHPHTGPALHAGSDALFRAALPYLGPPPSR